MKKEEEIHQKRKRILDDLINMTIKYDSFSTIQKAAKLQPNNPVFQDIKNKEEFLARIKVSSMAALMALGSIDWVEACNKLIEQTNKGLKINPNSAYLLYFRGRSKGDFGNFKEGLKDLDKCLKIKPDYSDAYVERGYIRQKMGNTSRAKNDYEKGVHFDPSLQQQVNSYLNNGGNKK